MTIQLIVVLRQHIDDKSLYEVLVLAQIKLH